MNNVFRFFSNFFPFNRWFSDFSAIFLAFNCFHIFQQLFCFQLFSDFSATSLLATATQLLKAKKLLKNLKPSG